MNSKKERYERDYLLLKSSNPNEVITLTGYSAKHHQNKNWITFTQIENEDKKRICGHLNLPYHKVVQLYPNILEQKNKPFQLVGIASFYIHKNTKRGALKILNIKPLF